MIRYFIVEKIGDYEKSKNNYKNKKYNIIQVDYNKINNKYEIFGIFSRSLKFPEYFGENWDAFYDCITDLSWLKIKNTVVLIKNLDVIKDENIFKIFTDALIDAKKFWQKDNVSFDTVLFIKKNVKSGNIIKFIEKIENEYSVKHKI